MSTIYQIASEAGVSPNTVSRVLNGKLKGNYPKVAKKAERILQIAERLNYRPNAAARAIQSQRTRQVGILLRNENTKDARFINLAAFEIVLGINERLKQDGYLATVVPIGEVRDLAGQSRVFREHLIDGMIVVGNTPRELARSLPRLVERVVWCDSDVWGRRNCIRRDETHAGMLAADALISAGYERLLFVGYAEARDEHYSSTERLAGVQTAARSAGVELETLQGMPWNHDGHMADHLRKHVRRGVGVVAADYLLARWITHTLNGVPDGVGLACCDESQETRVTWPDLARASFDRFALGAAAGEMLLGLMDGPAAGLPSRRISSEWIDGSTIQLQPGA